MTLSINTNNSAMVALETLNATQTELSATENAVSTGLKVSTAADNPAAFGIASQMDGNIAGQGAVNDGLSFASEVVSNTTSAANSILSVLNDVQAAVTSLGDNTGSTLSTNQINQEINGYLNQIDTIARNSTTNGVNLLSQTTGTLGITASSMQYVTGLQGDTASIGNLIADTSMGMASVGQSVLTDALGLSEPGNTLGGSISSNVFVTSGSMSNDVSTLIGKVQNAIQAMTNVTSQLGANTKILASMSSYGSTLSDNLTAGVGALTDADMSAESAKLTSLQTKQSLAIKSLTIANGQSQNILSLFQS